jgi:hydrogenase maturation protein HypF
MSAAAAQSRQRARVRIEGTVQGVGFRPHVYRIARQLNLSGYVCNNCAGVIVEVEGPSADIERLICRLTAEAPPLAEIECVTREERPALGTSGFAIAPSRADTRAHAVVTPDSATCAACLRELLDPADRRYRYPFINCTDCGPRFTIVRGVPYDRPNTTMAAFAMCDECRREYEDPADRRFHAQPNACARCGPSVALLARDGTRIEGDALERAAEALQQGRIVAIKGIGG